MVVVDTNIWIYYFTGQDERKRKVLRELLAPLSTKGILLPNQIFKEIAKVLTVNLKLSVDNTLKVLSKVEQLAIVYPEVPEDIKLAVQVKERFNLQFFDSVIVAFCLNRNVKALITEDKFMDKISYNDKELVLINPFD